MRKFEIHDLDINSFISEIEKCEGAVWMTTKDGDRLNLKSAFCRIVGIMSVVEGGRLSEATIECENENDESRLFRFNLYGKDE